MTYIGVPQPARAITSEDISEGAVTLADIAFTDTPSNLNLNGLYNNQTMRLAHNITVTGDTTLENSKAFTVSSSSGLLVSSAGHNLSDNDQILVQSNATLPTGLSANTYYFVINKTTDTFKLSSSIGGSAIGYTNAGSGTHTWFKDVNLILAKISDNGNPVTLTNDSSTRTITGIGSLETSTLAQTPNQSLTGMTGDIGSAVTGGSGLSVTGMTGELGSAVTGTPAISGNFPSITGLGTVTSGTLGSGVTFPAGHIIKISTHLSTTDIVKSASTGIAQEADANDLTVSCKAGNKLHIWIIGGFTYATATTGYFQCGMIIEESGQSDVLSFPSYLYSRASGDYKNDSHVSVTYSHTAITSSVTVKRAIHNPAAAVTSYWQAVNGYGVRYLIMEEQK